MENRLELEWTSHYACTSLKVDLHLARHVLVRMLALGKKFGWQRNMDQLEFSN